MLFVLGQLMAYEGALSGVGVDGFVDILYTCVVSVLIVCMIKTSGSLPKDKFMANLRNAKKALRQDAKRAARNKIVKAELKSLRVKFRKLLTAGNAEEAGKLMQLIGQKFDKASKKNVYKKNTVARYKSRMMKKLNALKKA